jgi:hypothetical protein
MAAAVEEKDAFACSEEFGLCEMDAPTIERERLERKGRRGKKVRENSLTAGDVTVECDVR